MGPPLCSAWSLVPPSFLSLRLFLWRAKISRTGSAWSWRNWEKKDKVFQCPPTPMPQCGIMRKEAMCHLVKQGGVLGISVAIIWPNPALHNRCWCQWPSAEGLFFKMSERPNTQYNEPVPFKVYAFACLIHIHGVCRRSPPAPLWSLLSFAICFPAVRGTPHQLWEWHHTSAPLSPLILDRQLLSPKPYGLFSERATHPQTV